MKYFSRLACIGVLLWSSLASTAQDTRLEIHQINVGNGDGALIMVWDNKKVIYTIVIDGGLKSTANDFIPYLKRWIPDIAKNGKGKGKKLINWVILSHNHQDHFKGLIEMFNDPAFIVRKITDQAAYDIGNVNYNVPLKVATNTNAYPFISRKKGSKTVPQPALVDYVKAVKAANDRAVLYDNTPITRTIPYDTTTKKFYVYTVATIGNVKVKLDCIAANGFTFGKAGRMIGGLNPNNFTFGWVVEFGKFRYYTGGDLGGNDNGTYTDQETPMADQLKLTYPSNHPMTGTQTATNFPGHVCAMKTNHHGSSESSNQGFLNTLAPSSVLTSAGNHTSWKIPTVAFVTRVGNIPEFDEVRGIYFTQLYNYKKGEQSLTKANALFKGQPQYNYVEPGKKPDKQYSYVLTVEPLTNYVRPPKADTTIDITDCSIYTVSKVQTDNNAKTAQKVYLCHKD